MRGLETGMLVMFFNYAPILTMGGNSLRCICTYKAYTTILLEMATQGSQVCHSEQARVVLAAERQYII